MDVLNYVGDALWVIALAIMAGASREAWKRIAVDARVPLIIGFDGAPIVRAPRVIALSALPAIAFLISLGLLIEGRNTTAKLDEALILFGVRATLAALFALAHLRWLKAVMGRLQAEGALRP